MKREHRTMTLTRPHLAVLDAELSTLGHPGACSDSVTAWPGMLRRISWEWWAGRGQFWASIEEEYPSLPVSLPVHPTLGGRLEFLFGTQLISARLFAGILAKRVETGTASSPRSAAGHHCSPAWPGTL
jgi:hypothetical protein